MNPSFLGQMLSDPYRAYSSTDVLSVEQRNQMRDALVRLFARYSHENASPEEVQVLPILASALLTVMAMPAYREPPTSDCPIEEEEHERINPEAELCRIATERDDKQKVVILIVSGIFSVLAVALSVAAVVLR